jgi:KEOPS complex subunit Cgi121
MTRENYDNPSTGEMESWTNIGDLRHSGLWAVPHLSGCTVRQVIFYVTDIRACLKKLRELSVYHGSHIICFNAEMMAGRTHVYSALNHAKRAVTEKTCVSSSFEIESLLYASGSRQCQLATRFGIHEGRNLGYLCICPENESLWNILSADMTSSTDDWEQIDDEKQARLISLFGITKEELGVTGLSRLKDLVIERVALLDVYK